MFGCDYELRWTIDESIRQLILQAIDGTISEADFERLQDTIATDDGVRTEYLRAVRLCESLGDIDLESMPLPEIGNTTREWKTGSTRLLSVAAAVMLLVGAAAFWLGRQDVVDPSGIIAESPEIAEESLIEGHAALRRSVDFKWPVGATSYREGDVLPDGRLQFNAGVAEIDFFCGATLIVEGPAILDIESHWLVRVVEGRLRANVPPAARGFTIKAADSEIIDLGTEFALEVGPEMARVEVLDGEVELRGGEHDGNHLVTGQSQQLKGTQSPSEAFSGLSKHSLICFRT